MHSCTETLSLHVVLLCPDLLSDHLCTLVQVVEFHPDQTIIESKRTPEQLELQPRDISIFAANKLGVQAQRATITPRSGAVLFRTEIAKAIIYKDKAVLFHSR